MNIIEYVTSQTDKKELTKKEQIESQLYEIFIKY